MEQRNFCITDLLGATNTVGDVGRLRTQIVSEAIRYGSKLGEKCGSIRGAPKVHRYPNREEGVQELNLSGGFGLFRWKEPHQTANQSSRLFSETRLNSRIRHWAVVWLCIGVIEALAPGNSAISISTRLNHWITASDCRRSSCEGQMTLLSQTPCRDHSAKPR